MYESKINGYHDLYVVHSGDSIICVGKTSGIEGYFTTNDVSHGYMNGYKQLSEGSFISGRLVGRFFMLPFIPIETIIGDTHS